MLYFSIALVVIAVIMTKYPPTFKFIKEIHVINSELSTAPVDIVDSAKLNEDMPPSLDDVMKVFNATIHEIVGGEDNAN